MSMLAEPRRKQRIGPNPRGKFFMEEEDNPGKSLLQKMGWKDGDGLGLQKQGIAEPIRPKIQMSATGLGFDVKNDPWVQHNQDFADVLKKLNENQIENTDLPENQEGNKHELETKSKSSRARIHYHKFVKGKDLSRASATDLKSIFGNSTETFESISKSSVERSEPIADSEEVTPDDESVQINMGSMADYFAKKMAGRGSRKKKEAELEAVENLVEQEYESCSPARDDEDTVSSQETKKRKKSKKKRVELENGEATAENTEVAEPEEETCDDGPNHTSMGSMTDYFAKKMAARDKAHRKKKEAEVVNTEFVQQKICESSHATEIEEAASTQETKKRKKSKKKHVELEANEATTENTEVVDLSVRLEEAHDDGPNHINMGSMTDYFAKKMAEREESRKTKKEAEVVDTDLVEQTCESSCSTQIEEAAPIQESKKRKKSKKKCVELEANETTKENTETREDGPNRINIKKKKAAEVMDTDLVEQACASSYPTKVDEAGSTRETKKRKKSKKKCVELEANEATTENTEMADLTVKPEEACEDGPNHINRGSMTDYFAKKMAEREESRKTKKEAEVMETELDTELVEQTCESSCPTKTEEAASTHETKKRKKSKKKRVELEANEATTENTETPDLGVKPEEAPEDGPNHITMGSMTDYFATKMPEREESRKTKKEAELEVVDTLSSERKRKSRIEVEAVEDVAAATNGVRKRKKSKLVNTELENGEPESTKNDLQPTIEKDDTSTQVLPKKKKKKLVVENSALEAEDVETTCETIEEEETLEERLKKEMIALKVKRPKDLSHDAMLRICKRFPGANLDRIKGYAFY